MKFATYFPSKPLQSYIQKYVVSENEMESEYKILPSTGMVMGFQYCGRLTEVLPSTEKSLHTAGVTGLTDRYKIFRNSVNTGSILVFFTEMGFAQFTEVPAHEIFNQSISLYDIFNISTVAELEEKLQSCSSDGERIQEIDAFFLKHLKNSSTDNYVHEALRLLHETKGTVRMGELSKHIALSKSPFEKRFRKVVGTSPKKYASLLRINSVMEGLFNAKSLGDICFEHGFFDQAHLIHTFKKYTGDTPEQFKRNM